MSKGRADACFICFLSKLQWDKMLRFMQYLCVPFLKQEVIFGSILFLLFRLTVLFVFCKFFFVFSFCCLKGRCSTGPVACCSCSTVLPGCFQTESSFFSLLGNISKQAAGVQNDLLLAVTFNMLTEHCLVQLQSEPAATGNRPEVVNL